MSEPSDGYRYNSPPNWPPPPSPDWRPGPDWRPDPSWSAAPEDWQFWVPADQGQASQPVSPAGRAPAPRRRPWVMRHKAFSILAAFVVLFVAIAVATSGNNGSNSKSAQPAPGSAAPLTAAQLQAAQLSAWWNGGGDARHQAISRALDATVKASSSGQVDALATACGQLQTAIEQAQAYDPVPVPAVQEHWAAALAQYARSATDCLSGATTATPSLLSQSADEMTAATSQLQQATAAINAISAH